MASEETPPQKLREEIAEEPPSPELCEEISRLACRQAEALLEEARSAREWLEARRRGEGDPEEGLDHMIATQGLHARAAHLVGEMDEGGYGEVEGRRRLEEARAELRKLAREVVDQKIADEDRAA